MLIEKKKIQSKTRLPSSHLNFGPQHPSAHGVLRLILESNAMKNRKIVPRCGKVSNAPMHAAYIRPGGVALDLPLGLLGNVSLFPKPSSNRLECVSMMANKHVYSLAVEKTLSCVIPLRAPYIRVLFDKMKVFVTENRILHLVQIVVQKIISLQWYQSIPLLFVCSAGSSLGGFVGPLAVTIEFTVRGVRFGNGVLKGGLYLQKIFEKIGKISLGAGFMMPVNPENIVVPAGRGENGHNNIFPEYMLGRPPLQAGIRPGFRRVDLQRELIDLSERLHNRQAEVMDSTTQRDTVRLERDNLIQEQENLQIWLNDFRHRQQNYMELWENVGQASIFRHYSPLNYSLLHQIVNQRRNSAVLVEPAAPVVLLVPVEQPPAAVVLSVPAIPALSQTPVVSLPPKTSRTWTQFSGDYLETTLNPVGKLILNPMYKFLLKPLWNWCWDIEDAGESED